MIFYRSNFDDGQRTSIWYLHILLVFAIGKLLRGDLDGTSEPPGFALFNEVLRLLPGISEIRAHGVAGIEILALIAVYYQNIDCKDDAATHV
jgi:proline utilization trans-activator